jgi:NADPH-dependent curcumin reductase CurA
MPINRRIVIANLPQGGEISSSTFRMEDGEVPQPEPGTVLCRTTAIFVGSALRRVMGSYLQPGMLVMATGVARVVASRDASFSEGDTVLAPTGWQEYALLKPSQISAKLPSADNALDYLGPLGGSGLAAYHGLVTVGRVQASEVVVVSAAAGSVGQLAGQFARIKGARVIGVCGGADKVDVLTAKLGFHHGINYKEGNIQEELKAGCPEGIDLYFDNTSGPILEAALLQMKRGGRIVCCGRLSEPHDYDSEHVPAGPRGVPGLLIQRRISMLGLWAPDLAAEDEKARNEIRAWLESGELTRLVDITHGLENAPASLIGNLAGGNVGTRIVMLE